ncbi:MAG TPA: GvpL/GvpF family gas vesicle protein [Methylococcus sp.]|nr:GvpL/GvpF family gas vesicle protein [Methylococcus sp.]
MARAGTKKGPGCYLYALAEAPALSRGEAITGIGGAPVYSLAEGEVAVVLSDIGESRIRPERRHIAAHHQVLRHLLERGGILPMAFGIIADSPAAVLRMLKTYRRSFAEQLRRLAGKVEMGLRVTLDTPNVFESYVQRFPELQVLRDRMLQGGGSREDKIELGRQFGQMLDGAREEAFEKIEEVLAPVCFEIHRNPVKEEKEIANLACLVARDRLGDFEGAIDEVAKRFDDDHVFRYSGPWPPHNFVKIDVEL